MNELTLPRNTFIFHETPQLALCPVTLFLANALLDSAFKVPTLCSAEPFYRLRVESGLNEQVIPWKDAILDEPVFRSLGWDPQRGWQMTWSVLSHRAVCRYIRMVSRSARWEHALTCYALRRGAANMVDSECACIPGVLSHVADRGQSTPLKTC